MMKGGGTGASAPPSKKVCASDKLLNDAHTIWIQTWFRVRLGDAAKHIPKDVVEDMLEEARVCTPPALPPTVTIAQIQKICKAAPSF